MTKILWITGDDDFAALGFEKKCNTAEEKKQLFDETLAKGNSTFGIKDYYDSITDVHFSAISMVFNDVDPEFIQFVRDNIHDENQAKDNNFYVIED